MGKKRKYLKVRASEVDLAGKPLPEWVAAPGGIATLGNDGKLDAKQCPDVKYVKSVIGVTSRAYNGISEAVLNSYLLDNSPRFMNTDEGSFMLTAHDMTPSSDNRAALFRRAANGYFYRVGKSLELTECIVIDTSGGVWLVGPGNKTVDYKGNIINNSIGINTYSELSNVEDTSSYTVKDTNDKSYLVVSRDGESNLKSQYLFTGQGAYQRNENVSDGKYGDFHPLSHPDYSMDINILPQRWLGKEAIFEKTVFVPKIDANTSLNISLDHGITLLGAKGSYSLNGRQRILPSVDITIEYENNWLNLLSNGQTLTNVRLIVEYTIEKSHKYYYYQEKKLNYIKYYTLDYGRIYGGMVEDGNDYDYKNWSPYFQNNQELWDYIHGLYNGEVSSDPRIINLIYDDGSIVPSNIQYVGGGEFYIFEGVRSSPTFAISPVNNSDNTAIIKTSVRGF